MEYPILASSTEDIEYANYEVNRGIGSVNRDFVSGFSHNENPVIHAKNTARKKKARVALLDAGCGTGYALYELKEYVNRTEKDVTEEAIDARGVSLVDQRNQADVDLMGWRVKKQLYSSYINLQFANLATAELPADYFDVAYSYQVLMHNESTTPIIANVLPSLAPGGAYYFDSEVDQGDEIRDFMTELPEAEWQSKTATVTQQFIGGEASKLVHYIKRTDTDD